MTPRRFHGFLERNRKKLGKFLPFSSLPSRAGATCCKPEMLKLLPLLKPWLSLDGDLRTHFKDERIRLGFSFQSKYLGMSPFRCPSLFSILSFLEYEHGVFHPIGGCGAVTTRHGAHRAKRWAWRSCSTSRSRSSSMRDRARPAGVRTAKRTPAGRLRRRQRRLRRRHAQAGARPQRRKRGPTSASPASASPAPPS